jgi:hypothetical protein
MSPLLELRQGITQGGEVVSDALGSVSLLVLLIVL